MLHLLMLALYRGRARKTKVQEEKHYEKISSIIVNRLYAPAMNEKDLDMANAIEYVNATKNVEEEKQEPTERRIVNRRSLFEKRMLIASIVTIVVLLIVVAVLLTTDLYNLFS